MRKGESERRVKGRVRGECRVWNYLKKKKKNELLFPSLYAEAAAGLSAFWKSHRMLA